MKPGLLVVRLLIFFLWTKKFSNKDWTLSKYSSGTSFKSSINLDFVGLLAGWENINRRGFIASIGSSNSSGSSKLSTSSFNSMSVILL